MVCQMRERNCLSMVQNIIQINYCTFLPENSDDFSSDCMQTSAKFQTKTAQAYFGEILDFFSRFYNLENLRSYDSGLNMHSADFAIDVLIRACILIIHRSLFLRLTVRQ